MAETTTGIIAWLQANGFGTAIGIITALLGYMGIRIHSDMDSLKKNKVGDKVCVALRGSMAEDIKETKEAVVGVHNRLDDLMKHLLKEATLGRNHKRDKGGGH